jgi:hypothetical protein
MIGDKNERYNIGGSNQKMTQVVEALTKLTSIINNQLEHLNKLRGRHPLTIRGFLVCSTDTDNAREQKFDWKNALIDATIISAVTFFSTLGTGHAIGLDNISGLKTATVAVLYFLGFETGNNNIRR